MQDAFYKGQPSGPQAVAGWMKQHAGDKPPPKVRILITTDGRMSDKASIQREAKLGGKDGRTPTGLELPDGLFVDLHGTKLPGDDHWAAELMPWK
jgi:hypothetical protein